MPWREEIAASVIENHQSDSVHGCLTDILIHLEFCFKFLNPNRFKNISGYCSRLHTQDDSRVRIRWMVQKQKTTGKDWLAISRVRTRFFHIMILCLLCGSIKKYIQTVAKSLSTIIYFHWKPLFIRMPGPVFDVIKIFKSSETWIHQRISLGQKAQARYARRGNFLFLFL